MQEKIEEIKHVQYTLWEAYKEFLDKDHSLEEYRNRTDALLHTCSDELQCFCKNLISVWTSVVEWLSEKIRNGEDIASITDCIKHIQNTAWVMYVDFLESHDMKKYNQKMGKLSEEYYKKGDEHLLAFCQNLFISWCSILSAFVDEIRKGF
jgi:hypothetical protein